jgi:hypothetical protein
MAHIADYALIGPATASRTRIAALIDFGSAMMIAVLRWSFGWALSALPSLAKLSLADPDSGTAAKLSGLPTRSTREPKG